MAIWPVLFSLLPSAISGLKLLATRAMALLALRAATATGSGGLADPVGCWALGAWVRPVVGIGRLSAMVVMLGLF